MSPTYRPELWRIDVAITKMVALKQPEIFDSMGQILHWDQYKGIYKNVTAQTILRFFGHNGWCESSGNPFLRIQHDDQWQKTIKEQLSPITVLEDCYT